MVLKKVGPAKSGKDQGSLAATFDWTDRQGNVVLTEDRVMTFHADATLRIIDVDVTLTSVQTVVYGDSKDGAFGIRLRPVLDEQGGTGKIVNAEGLTGERQVWGKPPTGAITRVPSATKRWGWRFSITGEPAPSRALARARIRPVCRQPVRRGGLHQRQVAEQPADGRARQIAALPLPGDRAPRRCAVGRYCGAVQQLHCGEVSGRRQAPGRGAGRSPQIIHNTGMSQVDTVARRMLLKLPAAS